MGLGAQYEFFWTGAGNAELDTGHACNRFEQEIDALDAHQPTDEHDVKCFRSLGSLGSHPAKPRQIYAHRTHA